MKKIILYAVIGSGAFLLLLLGIIGYVLFTNPFGLAILSATGMSIPETLVPAVPEVLEAVGTTSVSLPLSEEQAAIAGQLGVDPAVVPAVITPELEECFVTTLGEARVAEIKAGAAPSGIEIAKASGCVL